MSSLLIPNDQLVEADIPTGEDFDRYWMEFALSFPGYSVWGDGLGDIANSALDAWRRGERPDGTLSEVRGWLFFEQRRAHHTDDVSDYEYCAHLVGLIAEKV